MMQTLEPLLALGLLVLAGIAVALLLLDRPPAGDPPARSDSAAHDSAKRGDPATGDPTAGARGAVWFDDLPTPMPPSDEEAALLSELARSLRAGEVPAIAPAGDPPSTLVNSDGEIQRDNIERYLRSRGEEGLADGFAGPAGSDLRLFPFTTRGYFLSRGEVIPLYRGHRLLLGRRPHAGRAARRGPPGRGLPAPCAGRSSRTAASSTVPRRDRRGVRRLQHPPALRHDLLEDRALRGAARRRRPHRRDEAIDHLLVSVRTEEDWSVVVEDGYVKLGGNGLAILALARYTTVTGDRSHVPFMVRLGNWVLSTQADDGRFTKHKVEWETRRVTEFVSGYYPGEAIFALVALYGVDPKERWFDAADRAVRFLIEVRDTGKSPAELSHDHWLLYGLDALYRERPAPRLARHAERITSAILCSATSHWDSDVEQRRHVRARRRPSSRRTTARAPSPTRAGRAPRAARRVGLGGRSLAARS